MSLKENVDYIKEEISTQESFIENFFKLEKLYKKYKKVIISLSIICVVAVVGTLVSNYVSEQNRLAANNIFNICLENPDDKVSLADLKSKDENLYKLALYVNNKTANDTEFFKELSAYSSAMESEDLNALDKVTQSQKFLLKDFALFNKALIQAQKANYKEAKETLKLIPLTSNVSSLVKMLEHYMLTK